MNQWWEDPALEIPDAVQAELAERNQYPDPGPCACKDGNTRSSACRVVRQCLSPEARRACARAQGIVNRKALAESQRVSHFRSIRREPEDVDEQSIYDRAFELRLKREADRR